MVKKICMLSCTRSLWDDRIYWKEAVALKEAGYEVCHIGIGEEEFSTVTAEGIRLIQLPWDKRNKWLTITGSSKSNYRRLLAAASNEQADIYSFHDWQINIIGKKLKELPHKPRVVYDVLEATAQMLRSHGSDRNWFARIWLGIYSSIIEKWELRCAKHYDEIITCEDKVAEHFSKSIDPAKVTCVHNYSFFDPGNYQGDQAEKKYDIIYSGGIIPQKGIRELIDSMALIKMNRPEATALLIGPVFNDRFRRSIIKKIKSLGLEKNVVLHDPVPFSEIETYYRQSRIGMCTWYPDSKNAISIPVKIFEYMAMGLPVILTNKGVSVDYIKEDRTGLLVDPYKPRLIAGAILQLLKDPVLYDEMSRNCIRAVKEKYSWQKEKLKLLGVFARL